MYKKILVPLDGSELAECVLPHVETIARGCGTESVVFIRVVEPVYMPISAEPDPGLILTAKDLQKMEEEGKIVAEGYLKRLVERTKYDGVKIQSVVATGKAAETIAEYAAQNGVELITVATHGRSGVSRWVWGSVADKLLRSANVPILMIRSPGCGPVSI